MTTTTGAMHGFVQLSFKRFSKCDYTKGLIKYIDVREKEKKKKTPKLEDTHATSNVLFPGPLFLAPVVFLCLGDALECSDTDSSKTSALKWLINTDKPSSLWCAW